MGGLYVMKKKIIFLNTKQNKKIIKKKYIQKGEGYKTNIYIQKISEGVANKFFAMVLFKIKVLLFFFFFF